MYSSNICFQHAACTLAVSVITPSRSSRTASYRSLLKARSFSDRRVDRSPLASLIVSSSHLLFIVDRRPLISEGPVPDLHSGYIAVIAKDAQGAGIEQEMLASAGGQPDPPCHQGAQHVSVGKQRDVAIGTPRSRNHPIHPRTHLLWHLTARASIPKDQPARRHLMDLLRRQSLILAVIPLGEVGSDAAPAANSRQFAGLPRPRHRAAQNDSEGLLGEHRPHPLGEPAPIVGQRDIRRPGVLPAEAPPGFPMPDCKDVHSRLLTVRRCRPQSNARPRKPLPAPTSSRLSRACRRRSGR